MGARARIESLLSLSEENDNCLILDDKADIRLANRMVEKRELFRPLPGMYVRASTWRSLRPDKKHLWKVRTLQAKHPDWVFGGVSAAVVRGLSVSFKELDDVWVCVDDKKSFRRSPGIYRFSTDISSVEKVDDVRVTSIQQTLFDCARKLEFPEALVIVDSALHEGIVSKEALLSHIFELPNGKHGASQAYAVYLHSDAKAESGGESFARATMLEMGYQVPELQVCVSDPMNPRKSYRLDYCWKLDGGIVVGGELDGHEKYEEIAWKNGKSTIDALTEERLRESRITAHGIRMLRFSFSDVKNRRRFAQLLDSFGIPKVGVPRELSSKHGSEMAFLAARKAWRKQQERNRATQMHIEVEDETYLVEVLCEKVA